MDFADFLFMFSFVRCNIKYLKRLLKMLSHLTAYNFHFQLNKMPAVSIRLEFKFEPCPCCTPRLHSKNGKLN